MRSTASYDYARLIAAFGIVLFHAGAPGGAVGYAALPFFLILMIIFGWTSADRTALGPYTSGRLRRLLGPWVVWSGIFASLKLVEIQMTSASWGSEFVPYMLLTGPAIHLWFLPFAFVACLAIWPLVRLGRKYPPILLAIIALVGALVLQGVCADKTFAAPLAQWAYVAPAVCLGIGMAVLPGRAVAQLVLIGGFVGAAALFGWTHGLGQITLAAGAVVLCGQIQLPQTAISRQAAAASMGIYLAHPLMLSLLERATPLDKSNLLLASLAAGMALFLALGQQRVHLGRILQGWQALLGRDNTIASKPS